MTSRTFGVHSGNRNFISKSFTVILKWGRIFSLVVSYFFIYTFMKYFLNFYITTAEVGNVVVGSSPASYDIYVKVIVSNFILILKKAANRK